MKPTLEELKAEMKMLSDKIAAMEKGKEKPMDFDKGFNSLVRQIHYCDNVKLSKLYSKKLRIFDTLLLFRDEWNIIDGWERQRPCHAIVHSYKHGVIVEKCSFVIPPFAFQDEETAQLFLDTFKPQLEEIKEWL